MSIRTAEHDEKADQQQRNEEERRNHFGNWRLGE